jgi:hypothetical protein
LTIQIKNLELSSELASKNTQNRISSFDKINVFINDIWSKIRSTGDWDRSIIVVSSFSEFKKLKEIFKEKGSPCGYISEHSTKQKVQSVIAKFNSGSKKHILITERAIYFNILKPRRFKHLIFFSIPKFTWVFEDLMETLLDFYEYKKGKEEMEDGIESEEQKMEKQKLLICFGKKEFYELERVVGTRCALDFIKSKNVFKSLSVYS